MDKPAPDNKKITITYSVASSLRDIGKVAEDIALEQTVEVPNAAIRDQRILDEIVGKVLSVQESDAGEEKRFIVKIAYPEVVSAFQIPQFMNFLYGNISFKPGIKIVDMDLSREFLLSLKGPKFGIGGVRRLLGIFGRPLVSTALKPMGTSAEGLAEMCYNFALGGIDIIKDDHGLVDFPFCGFRERVTRCTEAIDRAQQETGKRALYFPNITDRFDKVMANVEFAFSANAGGLLVSPFLVGFDCVRYISENAAFDKPLMSHPSLGGSLFSCPGNGIVPEIVLGKIFRLIGVDCSVYPNYGGRFTFGKGTCSSIARALTEDFAHIKPSFPTPAGGMDLENIPEIVGFYGNDIILLIGGALYSRSDDLEENARYFCERVAEVSKAKADNERFSEGI